MDLPELREKANALDDSSMELVGIGRRMLIWGAFEDAVDVVRRAVRAHPAAAEPAHLLCQALIHQDKVEEARDLARGLPIDLSAPTDVLRTLSLVFRAVDDESRRWDVLCEVMRRDDRTAQDHVAYLELLINNRETAHAPKASLDQFRADWSAEPGYWKMLAHLEAQIGFRPKWGEHKFREQALATIRRVIRADPTDFDARRTLIAWLQRSSKPWHARWELFKFDRALRAHPSPQEHIVLCSAALSLQWKGLFRRVARRAITLTSPREDWTLNLAEMLWQGGMDAECRAILRSAVVAESNNVGMLEKLTALAIKASVPDTALRALDRLDEIARPTASIRSLKAQLQRDIEASRVLSALPLKGADAH